MHRIPRANAQTRFIAALLVSSVAVASSLTLTARADNFVSYDVAPYLDTSSDTPTLITDGISHPDPVSGVVHVALNDRVFLWNLAPPGPTAYYTNDPGFMPLSSEGTIPAGARASNLPGGATLGFLVRTTLSYWSGTGPVDFTPTPAGETLAFYLGASQVLIDDSSITAPNGFTIHTLDGGGGTHIHMNTQLLNSALGISTPAPTNGIYLVSLQTTVSGSANYISTPIYGLFNNQLSYDPQSTAAVAYMQRNWGVDANGAWSNPANWLGAVPNGSGQNATFWDAATASRTITLDAPVTVGRLEFINSNSYTLQGSATLTLDDPAGPTISSRADGSPFIAAPLALNGPLTITNESGVLTLSGPISANAQSITANITAGTLLFTGSATALGDLTKNGAGDWSLSGPQTYQPASTITLNAGTMHLGADTGSTGAHVAITVGGGAALTLTSTQHLTALQIGPAVVTIASGSAAVLVAGSLQLTGAPGTWFSSLNLNDNDMIVDVGHAATTADYSTAAAELAGYQRGAWNGPGISTDAAQAIGLITAANYLALHGSTAPFDNQTLSSSELLFKTTYSGDANLDGQITIADYALIDAAFLLHSPSPTWSNGDFNYDGIIDYRDYALLDAAFAAQGSPLSAALAQQMESLHAAAFGLPYLQALSAVPEPATLPFLAAACLLIIFPRPWRRALKEPRAFILSHYLGERP